MDVIAQYMSKYIIFFFKGIVEMYKKCNVSLNAILFAQLTTIFDQRRWIFSDVWTRFYFLLIKSKSECEVKKKQQSKTLQSGFSKWGH